MAERESSKDAPPKEHETRAVIIGLVLILLVAGYFVARSWWPDGEEEAEEETQAAEAPTSREDLPIIDAKTLQNRLMARESLDLIDIRPREAHVREHIPGSLSVTPEGLSNHTAGNNRTLVIVTSLEDEAGTATAYDILRQKSANFVFLEGGFEAWKADGYSIISQGDPNSFVDQSKVTYISPEELKKMLTENAQNGSVFLLDVQSPENYRRVHLTGSTNIPLDELERRRDEIPAGKEIIVYGENEVASFQGGVRLADLNFFSVRTLTGNSHLTASSPLFREP